MGEPDIDPFREDLLAMFETLSHGRIAPTDSQVAMWFRLLRPYSLGDVRGALAAFMREPGTGRSLPVPSDIIAKLDGAAKDDGRPGAEEAWAIALRSVDEAMTVVWTEETAQAWGTARIVLQGGDEVGARMAFRQAYERIVGEARAQRRRVQWSASLGHDKAMRADAISQAVDLGRLPGPDLQLLAGPASQSLDEVVERHAPQHARDALRRMREAMAARTIAPSADSLARAETARRQADLAASVDEYARSHGIEPLAPDATVGELTGRLLARNAARRQSEEGSEAA